MKKKEKEKKKNCAFMVEPSLIEAFDHYADLMGLSRSQLIRNVMDASVKEFKILEKSGILKSVVNVRDLFTFGPKTGKERETV